MISVVRSPRLANCFTADDAVEFGRANTALMELSESLPRFLQILNQSFSSRETAAKRRRERLVRRHTDRRVRALRARLRGCHPESLPLRD